MRRPEQAGDREKRDAREDGPRRGHGIDRRRLLRSAAGSLAGLWAGGRLAEEAARRGGGGPGAPGTTAPSARVAAQPPQETPYRVFLAPDDHTDYLWSADEETYREVFLSTLDWVLDRIDATADAPPEHQARWNCDGSLWLWTYEHHRDEAAFARLIERIRDGHVSVPLNPLVCCVGGAPIEAILRGMYYAGRIERRHGLRFRLAASVENQTLPYGLASLFAGAGARWSWKGICNCATRVEDAGNRLYDIYWWEGQDGRRLLMKWHSLLEDNRSSGGYAEARRPAEAVELVTTRGRESGFTARYPYKTIGLFGQGWEDLETKDDALREAAITLTERGREVVVSNQEDFFASFEETYGAGLPRWGAAFGNEWDLYVASMAEVTARVRRSTERLRSAEAMAVLACRLDSTIMTGREYARDLAFMNLGLYWEHDWKANGAVPRETRAEWQRRLAQQFEGYVEELRLISGAVIGDALPNHRDAWPSDPGGDAAAAPATAPPRFAAFNPLGWTRDGVLDLPWVGIAEALGLAPGGLGEASDAGGLPVHAVIVGAESPPAEDEDESGAVGPLRAQAVRRGGEDLLRLWVPDVPSVGYRLIEVRAGAAGGERPAPAAVVTGRTLVSDAWQLELDDQGRITQLLDRARGNRDLVREVDGRPMNALAPGERAGPGVLEVESAGPVSVTLRAAGDTPLRHVTRVTVYAESARLDIENTITEGFSSTYVWDFGFNLPGSEVIHEEVGAILRAKLETAGGDYAARNARYDWLSLGHFAAIGNATHWAALSNADCAFFKVGRSTTDLLDGRTPRLSILAGGQVDGPELGIRDQGGDERFTQRFALWTADRYDAVATMRQALEHQNPLVAIRATGRGGPLPATGFSLLDLDDRNVLLWALKPGEEDPAGTIVGRAWNLAERQSETTVSLSPPWTIREAIRTSHIETPIPDAPGGGDRGGGEPAAPTRAERGRARVGLGPRAIETWAMRVTRLGTEDPGRAVYLPAAKRD